MTPLPTAPFFDLLVRGGTVVTATSEERLDIGVVGEHVAALLPSGGLADARTTLDATGCLVLPGGVDPHVHYDLAFGQVRSEPPEYSVAAAYGGTTTVVDFALQEPPATLHEAIETKRGAVAGRMAVDYGLHAIVTGSEPDFELLDEVGDVIRGGVPTIKTFMTYGWMVDDGYRWGLMQRVAEHGGMSLVHAEDDAIASFMTAQHLREGKTHGAYISDARGPLVEEAAIRRAMLLAERSGSALYVLHMAAGSGVRALQEGRLRGLPFYGETLTPYLSFTAAALWDDARRGLLWNNYPTLKGPEDREELWRALADGGLQVIASDQFATTVADHYERMGTTVDNMQAGHANVELRLPVAYHLGVAGGRLSANRLVDLVSTAPARLMGLYPRKGTIAVGSDADLIVFDHRRTWTVDHEELHMRSDYSCWQDWTLTGQVVSTVLRGTVLIERGRWVGPTGHGCYLPRRLAPDLHGHT
jgi:dihydropyrimidinase